MLFLLERCFWTTRGNQSLYSEVNIINIYIKIFELYMHASLLTKRHSFCAFLIYCYLTCAKACTPQHFYPNLNNFPVYSPIYVLLLRILYISYVCQPTIKQNWPYFYLPKGLHLWIRLLTKHFFNYLDYFFRFKCI